jgi:type IV secretory pathway protease TraF
MKARLLWIALGLIGVALGAASFLPHRPMFVWNFTASAPLGLYRALPHSALERDGGRGVWVAVEPSPEMRMTMAELGVLEPGRLLIKRIAATSGDEVCRQGLDVRINGVLVAVARAATSTGTLLPFWSGCRLLGKDQVFLLGVADGSFDGRYFGVTSVTEIIAPLQPFATFSQGHP